MNRMRTLFKITASLFMGLGIISLAFGYDPKSECWRDYPSIPMREMNYEVAFARETLAPDRITIDGRILKKGMSEKHLSDILGMDSTASSNWVERDAQGQCEYLLELLKENPNSMHLYILGDIKHRKMEGLFRTSDWRLSNIGRLRAFLFRRKIDSSESVYLYYFAMDPIPVERIKRVKGKLYRLDREGQPRVQWDVDSNQVLIEGFLTRKDH